MELAKITARGQTTIPKKIREEAKLSEGDRLPSRSMETISWSVR